MKKPRHSNALPTPLRAIGLVIVLATTAACGGGSTDDPAGPPRGDVEACSNNIDDDLDGLVDCSDSDCSNDEACAPPPTEQCTNGNDDDRDGLVDCADADCSNDEACAPPPDEQCTNGNDDDRDGLVDCADVDCSNDPACAPPPAEQCANGNDDDRDGLVDCADADCTTDPACRIEGRGEFNLVVGGGTGIAAVTAVVRYPSSAGRLTATGAGCFSLLVPGVDDAAARQFTIAPICAAGTSGPATIAHVEFQFDTARPVAADFVITASVVDVNGLPIPGATVSMTSFALHE